MATTQVADLIVPEVFAPYVQQLTTEKSALIQSGVATIDAELSASLAGGGLTFNEPSLRDLANDADNVGDDVPGNTSTPNKLGSSNEIQVRLSRNSSWSTMDLSKALAGVDPATAIANRVSAYWTRRLQVAFIATMQGMFAMEAAVAINGSTHVQDDMTNDITGVFADGVTNFSAAAFIDTVLTMDDSSDLLGTVFVHPIVYGRMLKNNLIDFITDSTNPDATKIEAFQGRRLVVDKAMPSPSAGVFETWVFGANTISIGQAAPDVPVEVKRNPDAGNGSGEEILHSRVQWIIHINGHAYVGSAPNGGPSNAGTANNLGAATSWERRFPERNQIQIARLITTEF